MRADSWTQEEKNLLKEIYVNNSKEFILSKFKRSWASIYLNAKNIGLKRDLIILKQEMIEGGKKAPAREDFWTFKENNLLKEIYENNSKEFIILKFNNKTWKAIREHARRLNLLRNKTLVNKDIVDHNKITIKARYGVEYSTQLSTMQEKSRQTNMERRGVEYPPQSAEVREKMKDTVQKKYGVDNVFQSEEIKKRIIKTNLEKFGCENPNQNEEIRKKSYNTAKLNDSFSTSDEEDNFYNYLSLFDPNTEHHILHPIVRHTIDYYMPRYNLWVQYDGIYWHGKEKRENNSLRAEKIEENIKNDKIQNENIPNLIRFWSDDVNNAIQKNIILDLIKNKINEKKIIIFTSHQYRKKLQLINEDIKFLDFDPSILKAISFTLIAEKYNNEMAEFIKRYEWLGSIGTVPKWCFTARYKGLLGGVVFINEPINYSKILGPDTMRYEALIQRGASVSWAPKNLGSHLLMFACRWMIQNTDKRLFIGYGDPKAIEIGTIYQACNFEYLGNNFGSSYLYSHPSIKNNRMFSKQSLKRVPIFKQWCKQEKIVSSETWFKKNGLKNIQAIPNDIKNQWNSWNKKILSEAHIFITEKKYKYVLVLSKNKKEQKKLNLLKSYITKSYPKRNEEFISDCIKDPNIIFPIKKISISSIQPISRKDRKTPEKIQFIINNYKNKTCNELAQSLNETKRWIQSQIKYLQKEGKLFTKNPVGCTKNKKSDEKLNFIIENKNKLTRIKMAEILKETPRWIKRQIIYLKKIHRL